MTNSDGGNKPTGKDLSKSRKPDAELKENELDQIAGGVALAKPANPHRKKPMML